MLPTACFLRSTQLVLQLVKKLPSFYETRMFITAFIKARYFFHINPVYYQPNSLRSILILSYHLRRGLPSGHFPSCFLAETLYKFLLSPTRATGPIHLFILDLITWITFGVEYKSRRSSISSSSSYFLHLRSEYLPPRPFIERSKPKYFP